MTRRETNVARSIRRTRNLRQNELNRQVHIGKLAECYGIRPVAAQINVSPQLVNYYRNKARDPNFHSNSHGGSRGKQFSPETAALIERVLWEEVKKDPTKTLDQYCKTIVLSLQANSAEHQTVSKTYISNIFHCWGWRYDLRGQNLPFFKMTVTFSIQFFLSPLAQFFLSTDLSI